MQVFRFDLNDGDVSAYTCDAPGNHSGEYYKKEDVNQFLKLFNEAADAMALGRWFAATRILLSTRGADWIKQ